MDGRVKAEVGDWSVCLTRQFEHSWQLLFELVYRSCTLMDLRRCIYYYVYLSICYRGIVMY